MGKRVILLPLIIALALLASGVGLAGGDWAAFVEKQDGFKIDFPGRPKPTTSTSTCPMGKVTSHTYTVDKGPSSYSVTCTELPGVAVLLGGSDRIYDSARDGLLHHVQAKATSWKTIVLDHRGGRELIYDVAPQRGRPGLEGDARMVLVASRLYVVDVLRPKADRSHSADRFLGSFQPLSTAERDK